MPARPYSPDEDKIIIAARLDGVDFTEIAATLGRPVGSVRARVGS